MLQMAVLPLRLEHCLCSSATESGDLSSLALHHGTCPWPLSPFNLPVPGREEIWLITLGFSLAGL